MEKLLIKPDSLLKDSSQLAWNVYESGFEPNYIIALKEHFSADEINFLLKESTKKIYVSSNETVFINLWWKEYEDTIKNRKKMKWIRTGLSSIIISILIILNT